MRSRLLAFVAAVAMVVVAVQVRAGIDDGDDRPRLVCATELAEVCASLADRADTTVEPAAATATGDVGDVDGWVVHAPWPQLVDAARRREGDAPLFRAGAPLASMRVGLAVWPDRLAALRKACGREVDWACVAQAATTGSWATLGGDPGWGAFKLGFPDPRRDALGLLALGSLAAALAPEWPAGNEEFPGTVATVARSVPRPLPPLATVLAGGPALADAYVVAVPPAAVGRMTLVYPAPVVTADVVLARRRNGNSGQLAAWVRAARIDGNDGPGVALDVGTLEGLRALWDEVAP
jgi:hypothetical protein